MTPDSAFWSRLLGVLTLEIAMVVAALALCARWIRPPQLRRSLWHSGLVALALITVVEFSGFRSFVTMRLPVTHPPSERRLVALVHPLESTTFTSSEFDPGPSIPQPDASAPTSPPPRSAGWWPGLLWLLGALLLGLRTLTLRAWLGWERRRTKPGDTETRATIARLEGPLGLRRVELRVWARLRGPIAFGTLWPTIAVPADFAARFTPAQREAMIAHELAHLAGRDPFWLAAADAVCALLWWHPGVWWARHQLRAASEQAADEASALVPEGGVAALAESLVAFGRELATPGPARSLGVAGSGFRSELGRRVAALLETPPVWRPPGWGQRWRMRCAVVGGVIALAALPWPGPGEPSALAFLAHAASAVSSVSESSPKARVPGPPVSETIIRAALISNALAYDTQTGVVTAWGGVVIQSGSSTRTADAVQIDATNDTLVARGDIRLQTAPMAGAAASQSGFTSAPNTGAAPLPTRVIAALREPGVTVEPAAASGLAAPAPAGSPGVGTAPQLYTRTYRLADPVQFVAAIRQTAGMLPSTNIQADVNQFLVACGLDFAKPDATALSPDAPDPLAPAVYFNDRTGALFVRATLADLDRTQRILAVLNVHGRDDDESVGPAITLKVQLADVRVDSAEDLGLDWLFGRSPTNNPVTETTRPDPKAATRVDTLTSKGEWVTLKAVQFDALSRSLENHRGIDFLTAPEVTTRSGRQAQVAVQDVRSVVTGVKAAVDPRTQAVGFDDVSVSVTNTTPGINYQVESIATGPAVDVLPYAENDGWRLITVARVTEFLGYEDPGKGNEAFVQVSGAKPLKAQKPLARILVREMVATAFAKPGETVALRGAMVTRTNIVRSRNWLVRRSQTNVVSQRLYAFITPQFAPAAAAGDGASVAPVQPVIVRVMAAEPGIRVGHQWVKPGDLPVALKAEQAAKPNLRLIVRADADAPPARFQTVLEEARQAGIPTVSLSD
ncbi:MAG: hypothetical protein KF791_08770 [Verrucomicrobiae bacterium]|nr:hypothetical protein [Verrucomicrobiae bacterium]